MSDYFQAQLERLSTGSTAEGLKASKLPMLRVLAPPLTEQSAIVGFLERETAKIDALIAKKERLIELLQEKREALIAHSFTGRVGRNCKARKLRRVLWRVKRPVLVEPESEYQEIGIRSWGKGIFHKDPLRGAVLEDKSVYRVEPGDFVFNIVFAWEGAVAIVSSDEQGMVASHRFPTFRHSPDVDLDYLLGFL